MLAPAFEVRSDRQREIELGEVDVGRLSRGRRRGHLLGKLDLGAGGYRELINDAVVGDPKDLTARGHVAGIAEFDADDAVVHLDVRADSDDANLGAASKQRLTVEFRIRCDAVDLALQCQVLGVQVRPLRVRYLLRGGLNGQAPHAHHDVADPAQRALGDLQHRSRLAGIDTGLVQARNFRA